MTSSSIADEFWPFYRVKKDDTISSILYQLGVEPIYGKKGFLLPTLALNDGSKENEGEKILPGELIFLPVEYQYPITERFKILASGEVVLRNENDGETSFRKIASTSDSIPKEPESSSSEIQPIKASSPSFERYSEIEITPVFFYSKIEATDPSNGAKGNVVSDLNKGIQMDWSQNWSEKTKSSLNLGLTSISIRPSDTRTISQQSHSYSHFSVGLSHQLSEKVSGGFSLSMEDEIFYHLTSATNVSVNSVSIPQAAASLDYKLLNLKPYELKFSLKGAYLFSGSTDAYSVKSGRQIQGRVFIRQELSDKKWHLTGGVFYRDTRQNTSLLKVRRTDLGMDLGLSRSFGP